MEYSEKDKQVIIKILNTYNKFNEDGKEQFLSVNNVDPYKNDFIYSLISEVSFFKTSQYPERAAAIENLTVHLIVDTVLPVNYKDTKGLSLFDKAIIADSDPIQKALKERYERENQNRLSQVQEKFKQKNKRYKKK